MNLGEKLAELQKPQGHMTTYIDTTSRNESNASLRVTRFILAQELELVVLKLKVTNIAITVK